MPRPKSSHTVILEAALAGLEAQRHRLDEQIAEVRTVLGPKRRATLAPAKPRIGAAGRKRIAEAQRKRWAVLKKARTGK